MNRKKLIIGIVAIIVIVAGLVIFFNKNDKTTPTATPVAAHATVQITDKGFVPSNLSISQGTTVVWVNQDAKPHQVVADPYPSGDSLPQLFAKQPMGSEETYSFTFSKAGEWAYHDQLHPEVGGVVTVQ